MSPLSDDELRFKIWKRYRVDPSRWMEEILGTDTIEDYQDNLFKSIVKFDKVCVKACHSVGKTWGFGRMVLWFYSMFPNSIIITTAPTYRQVKALLWGEIRDAYKTSKQPIGGRLLDVELKLSDKHYAIGFSPQSKTTSSKEQQGSSFQGFHSDYVLIVFDEATGISPDVWVMAQGLLTSGKIVKFIAIANPTTKNCTFFECFSDPSWHNMTISCFDSPNMIANGLTDKAKLKEEIDYLSTLSDAERIQVIQDYDKPRPYLVMAQFIVPYVMKLGFDHPLVLSKCFGEFPHTEDNVLVQYEDVVRACNREVKLEPANVRYIGVDVARFGADKTVISEIIGYKHVENTVLTKRDLVDVAGAVMRVIDKSTHRTVVSIDSTGLGAGVYDMLMQNQRQKLIPNTVQIEEVHFGAGLKDDEDKTRYYNLKAKMFDVLASDLRDKLDLLDESIYQEELPTVEYKFDSKGRIVIESKKDYKARTGRPSPDFSDALALANYGRYVKINYGSFKGHGKSEPIVKRKGIKPRKSGIKIKEY